MISVNEDDHAMRSIRDHRYARVVRDLCEDCDLRFEVDDVAKRAFGIPKQRRNLHARQPAVITGYISM
jgi:hypothetical protein